MTMRKIALCLSILLLTALLFPGCAKQANTPAPTETSPTSPTEPIPTDPTPTVPSNPEAPKVTPSGNSSPEDELRLIADQVIKEQYGITDLSCFEINIDHYKNGKATVSYELYIHGYPTNGELWVKFDANGQFSSVQDVNDFGMYVKYLPNATPEAVQAAVKQLDAMVRSHAHPDYYFNIDLDGYLCLGTEVIIYIENPKTDDAGNVIGGCGFDHKHTFPSVRVCHYQ